MKDFCRTISKRVLIGLAAFCCSLAVVAQNEVTVGSPTFSGKYVEKEEAYYSLINSEIAYDVVVKAGYTVKEQVWTLTCDGDAVDKSVTADKVRFVAAKAGVYELAGRITLGWKNEKNEEKTSTVTVEGASVWVIAPELIPTTELSYVVYTDEMFTMTFDDRSNYGENAGNGTWDIQWAVTPDKNTAVNKKDAFTYTSSYKNSTSDKVKAKYTATCKFLVAGTELYVNNFDFVADVYPQVKNEGDDEIVLNTAEERNFDLSFEAKGGYDTGWTYQWYLDGEKIEAFAGNSNKDTRSIQFTPADEYITFNYKVVATNSYEGKVWDTIEKVFIVNVFPVLGIEQVSPSVLNFAGDRSIKHEVSTTGGCPDGWSYKWTRKGASAGKNSSVIEYDEKAKEVLEVVKYNVVATNKAQNGNLLGTREAEFTVNVYPALDVNAPKNIFNYIEGDEVEPFVLNKKGGNPDGWVIEWKKGDEVIECSEFSYEVTFESPGKVEEYNYFATVKNVFEGEIWYGPETFPFEANKYLQINIKDSSALEFNTAKEEEFKLKLEVEGGYENGWTYQWTRNSKNVQNGNVETTGFETVCSVNETTPTNKNVDKIIYKVTAMNKARNGEKLGECTLEYNVNVYMAPVFNKQQCHHSVVGDIAFELPVEYTGGNDADGAWTLTWERNGVLDNDRKNKTEKFAESYMGEGDYTDVNYTVRAVNKFRDETWFDDTIQFPVKVYKPIELDYFVANPGAYDLYDRELGLGAVYKGGVTEDGGGSWTYEWINKTNPMAEYDNNIYNHNACNKTSTVRNDDYEFIIRHFVDGDSIWGTRYNYAVRSYPKAVITPTKMDTILCGGNDVKFGIKAQYADPDGWSFEWKRNGKLLSETSSILKYLELNDDDKESYEHEYVLHATNRHNNEVWVDTTFTYGSIVRPKLFLPVQCDYEVLLREGDNIELASTAGEGGCINGWEYIWYNSHSFDNNKILDGQEGMALHNHTSDKESKGGYGHNHMEKRIEKYMLHVRNIDEIGRQVHYADTFYYEVTIHRRPKKPFKLLQKGNGTSNIYIVDMKESSGLTDSQLVENEYNFSFGYGNNEIVREDYTLRYQQYPKIGNDDLPWVYSYWEYDNGYVCKSDKVNSDTRAVSGAVIEDVIEVSHKGFKASLRAPMPANVRVMAFNGTVVKKISYNEQVEFDEKIDLNGLCSGLYLIEVCIGENREVNKIYIK